MHHVRCTLDNGLLNVFKHGLETLLIANFEKRRQRFHPISLATCLSGSLSLAVCNCVVGTHNVDVLSMTTFGGSFSDMVDQLFAMMPHKFTCSNAILELFE